MSSRKACGVFPNGEVIRRVGLDAKVLRLGIEYTYSILDLIDAKLSEAGSPPLAMLVELANLSTIVGNLLAAGVAENSSGRFLKNRPHTYPDLLSQDPAGKNIEIKVSLDEYSPKGHLAKIGYYMTLRYVLGEADGSFQRGKASRGDTVWIFELRVGHLDLKHFNLSNTDGDSGKTAVINRDGILALSPVYVDMERCPFPERGRRYKAYNACLSEP